MIIIIVFACACMHACCCMYLPINFLLSGSKVLKEKSAAVRQYEDKNTNKEEERRQLEVSMHEW